MGIAVAAYHDVRTQLQTTARRLEEIDRERTEYREDWHEEAKRSAVLEARMSERLPLDRLRNFVLTLGGLVGGGGLSDAIAKGTVWGAGGLFFLVGLILILVPWVSRSPSSKRK